MKVIHIEGGDIPMNKKMLFEDKDRLALYDNLKQLNKDQFKIFYGAFVHFWANYKFFISKQNLFNLRCELNKLCHELDESFPDQYDDYEMMKSFFWHIPIIIWTNFPLNLWQSYSLNMLTIALAF